MIDRSVVTVLVADDHPVFRLGLAMALRQFGFGRVVEAVDGNEALRACLHDDVDVAVLDVKMPELNGLDVVRVVRACDFAQHAPRFVVMSAFDQPAVVKAGADLHVDAFLGKETSPERLAVVIDRVLEGGIAGGDGVTKIGVEALTPRERDVLRLLCTGHPTKAIASSLGLSPETVKDHLTRLYAKLDVHDRAAAVDAAHRLGWVTLADLS